jgi:hypothetical protein
MPINGSITITRSALLIHFLLVKGHPQIVRSVGLMVVIHKRL